MSIATNNVNELVAVSTTFSISDSFLIKSSWTIQFPFLPNRMNQSAEWCSLFSDQIQYVDWLLLWLKCGTRRRLSSNFESILHNLRTAIALISMNLVTESVSMHETKATCETLAHYSPSLINEVDWSCQQEKETVKAYKNQNREISGDDAHSKAVDRNDPPKTLNGNCSDTTEDIAAPSSISRRCNRRKRSFDEDDSNFEASYKRVKPDEEINIMSPKCASNFTDSGGCSDVDVCSVDEFSSEHRSVRKSRQDGKESNYISDSSGQHYCGKSRRTLYIEYWSRSEESKVKKWDHIDGLRDKYEQIEDHIFDTSLKGRTAFLEPNMFPYMTPAGIEHWTLWHIRELSHEQIKQYVENWIDANAPHVESWNYDDNAKRSIEIFHVHVYLQCPPNDCVLRDRKVEDLMHELD
uniref:Uncharacterized protein AlNc14C113G6440 n=1 Tax=Albugo laibachii Nc14 TaxID=890382 RepID=F0WIP7_9STRA|nr:conserved hypothetical protein [Albugo laibachii Nc14]|eukprot:CCA21138.1 conserved hypothetical protein [Albugo laibachii Nc14]